MSWGLIGQGLLLLAVFLKLAQAQRLARNVRWLAALGLMIVVWVPFGDLSLAGYVRGAAGDLSITSVWLLMTAVLGRLLDRSLRGERSTALLLALVLLTGLWFYPLSLGVGPVDPYQWGYRPWGLGAVLALLAAAAWWRQLYLVTIVLSLALLAWSKSLYESANLWDYMIDPLLLAYALGYFIKMLGRKALSARNFSVVFRT
jgi:hypothetical protein